MTTAIIIIILILIGIFAVRSACRHMKGRGGCCGGGGSQPPEFKRLEGTEIGRYLIQVEGMHCASCKNNVEHAVNRLEGAVGNVFLERGLLTVHCDREISGEKLRKAVEKAGYTIVSLKYVHLDEK